ncbi:metal ABC transporter ATP-binding protein [Myxacorys almedinensis]|uniref:ATP-binding cassette domain-containing protein n=1 Tax=Myxacorys almedinensis A TaxID=2690445 RepID=A0A8J7Z3I4_9CYAN|nr:metal ABC transporter ATP-binding protein [Myxacorys almedinensis]NDJ17171.1 ATP-binding cassette domain-containing protein [Myxacorys almedinensis A]
MTPILPSKFDTSFPVIQVSGLTVYRGQYAAVENVSFDLLPGTSSAIVGPNGSGKSTLVQAILDLIPHTSGSVQIFGRPIQKLGKLRHEIGYMPQNFIFDRSFPISVAELVRLGWVKTDRAMSQNAALSQALQRVNATHLRHQAIGTLSGGELKRVLLAYCLVVPRKLLILDEAFAEVDVQGEADFYSLLDELRREESWTLLQVSHDLDMVGRHCDQVLCLNRSLICSGQPETALSPQNLLQTYGSTFSRYHHQH